MNSRLKIFFAGLFLVLATATQAQEQQTIDAVVQQIVESLAESQSEDAPAPDYQELYEALSYYWEHPLNINTATKDDFEKLLFLNAFQIQNLLKYRHLYGTIVSLYELQAVDGFDQTTIQHLLPFITLAKDSKNQPGTHSFNRWKYAQHQIIAETHRVLQTQKGYLPQDSAYRASHPNAHFLGNPYRYYVRYKGNLSHQWFWNITMEKDAGEPFFKTPNRSGFDYYSAHLFYRNNSGILRKVALGDYHLQFGQGLALWSSMSFGKSSMVLNTMKSAMGLKPYSSTDENRFFRGIATALNIGKSTLTVFYSNKKTDARILDEDTISSSDEQWVSSLQNTGYHRTESEFAGKDALGMQVWGGHWSLHRFQHIKIGLTGVHYHFSMPLEKSEKPYRQYRFSGNDLTNLGVDYQYAIGDIYGFGEVARSDNGALAMLHGINFSLASNFMLSTLYRHYARNYQSIYTAPFGENALPENEQGFYLGFTSFPVKYWTVSAYADMFRFPWLRYGADAPSNGYDYLTMIDFQSAQDWSMHSKLRSKMTEKNNRLENNPVSEVVPVVTTKLRYHVDYQANKNIILKSRVAWTFYQKQEIKKTGFLVYQDILYRPPESRLSLAFRMALFQTDGYDARLYAYENDVLYAFSVPAYFDTGKRTYILLKYDFSKNLSAWIRISAWFYDNKTTISSGLNEIDGHSKSTAKFQVRYKF